MKTGKKRLTGTLLALCAALLVLCIFAFSLQARAATVSTRQTTARRSISRGVLRPGGLRNGRYGGVIHQ